jgi:predicted XRE-type DNA-binding protein
MFNLIKGFTKYEISETGIIRNVKTKMIVSKENDGKNVRMINDEGERKSVKVSDLKAVTEKDQRTKKAFDDLRKGMGIEQKTSLKKLIAKQSNASSKKKGKISKEQAEEIRSLYKAGNIKQKDLAKKFGVHASTISEIINFKIKKK